MSTVEVQSMLGLTQGRVSQLVKEGLLSRELDGSGRAKYDRVSVERLARDRAARAARTETEAAERSARRAEDQARFRRAREREEAERLARQEHQDDLREREVKALEGIYECLRNRY